MRASVALLVAVTALACARGDGPAQPVSRTVDLVFRDSWVRGTLKFDVVAARTSSAPLPMEFTLRLTSASDAVKHLRLGQLSGDSCFRVRVLHRTAPNAPARPLESAAMHAPVIWSAWPMVCFQVGMQWSWQVMLQSPADPPASAVDGRVTLLTERRSTTEQISVVVLRLPQTSAELREFNRNVDAFVAARSEWISLH